MNITMIPTNKIFPNPNNRRTDLGDLSELTDSIKAMGVLQNLTVVPYSPTDHAGVDLQGEDNSDCYIVVIGNRRYAAAKAAKISELPCEISDMDLKAQSRVIMVENLMREGLTPYQEALCIQTMLDLGDTVDDIAQQTGFSKTKVRNRAKLASFDKDKFAESETRGGTMEEYLAAAKIEDAGLRNELLQHVGTKNFQWKLSQAQSEDNHRKNVQGQLERLATFATEVPERMANTKSVTYIYPSDKADKFTIPKDAGTTPYFYRVDRCYIELFRHKTPDELADESSAQQEGAMWKANNLQLEEAALRAFDMRLAFVKGLTPAKCKKLFPVLSAFMYGRFKEMSSIGYWGSFTMDEHLMGEILGITVDEKTGLDAAALKHQMKAAPELVTFCMMYAQLEGNQLKYSTERYVKEKSCSVPMHTGSKTLDKVYELLTFFGYQMSEEEKSLQNGSNALYYKEEAAAAA